jgi:hypothetical protein
LTVEQSRRLLAEQESSAAKAREIRDLRSIA